MKVCDICDGEYEPTAPQQRYCSKRCAMDGENAVRTAKRMTLCVKCGERKTRNHFLYKGKTCNECRTAGPKERRCSRCRHNKPRGEFMFNGKLCAECRDREAKNAPRQGWEGSNCLRCATVEDCQFLVSFGLPVLCGNPDEKDWFVYSTLPADVVVRAAELVW